MKHLLLLLGFILVCHSSYAQSFHLVKPSDTDSLITTHNTNHFAFFDTDQAPKNELLVFFPGTGGAPIVYLLFLREAARLGYHAIGLSYPNSVAINSATVCALTLNPECHGNARMEIFDGIDRHPTIDVNPSNSIQNRLKKVVSYLDENFPSENWGQYLIDDEIQWPKLKLAGHSQGAGHSGFIARFKEVERVIYIAGNDWVGLLNQPASWILEDGVTGPNRYFGFMHEMDQLVNIGNALETWGHLGILDYGDLVNVDLANPPYNSNALYTQFPPRDSTDNYHGSPVVDIHTPRDDNDDPIYTPVWHYLLDSPIPPLTKVDEINPAVWKVYPNPSEGYIYWNDLTDLKLIEIINWSGQIIQVINNPNSNSIELGPIPDGIYYLRALTEEGLFLSEKIIKH